MADSRVSDWPGTVESIAQIAVGDLAESWQIARLIDWHNDIVNSIWNNSIGLIVEAGGITVTAGGITVTGASTITSTADNVVPLTINGFSATHTAALLNINRNSGGANIIKVSGPTGLLDSYIQLYNGGSQNVAQIGGSGAYTVILTSTIAVAGIDTAAHAYVRLIGSTGQTEINGASSGSNGTVVLQTNSTAQLTCAKTGGVTIANGLTVSTTGLTVTTGASTMTGLAAGSSTALTVITGADTNTGLIVRRNSATQSDNLITLQSSTPATLSYFDPSARMVINAPAHTFANSNVACYDGNILCGSASATALASTGIYDASQTSGVLALYNGTSTSGNTYFADIILATNQTGTTNLVGRIIAINTAIAGADKRVFQQHIITDGATNSAAIVWNTANAGSFATRMRLAANGFLMIPSVGLGFYTTIGTVADGDWQFTRSGNDLLVQRRESGAWATKHTFSAA